MAEGAVARATQQAPHGAGLVAVINPQALSGALAYSALAALCLLVASFVLNDFYITLANNAKPRIEPILRTAIEPETKFEWGTSHHPGMTDIAAILPAPLPWNDDAAERHTEWMLQAGAIWWNCFASLAGP